MALLAFKIKNFDNYFITNTGDVYSRNYKQTGRLKKLKPMVDINGYLTIDLFQNGKRFNKKIHRLVAEAFIPNPDKKPCINHINGKHNCNCVENLEWCTYNENMLHSYRVLHRKSVWQGKIGKAHPNSRPVLQIRNGVVVNEFSGLAEAERETKTNQNNIRNCCRGRTKSAGGCQWAYKQQNIGE